MPKQMEVLYIVNFYGSPPLNYFERYTKKSSIGKITIIKLPAVRLTKGRLFIDSFIIDSLNKRYKINIDIKFPFPAIIIFFSQYIINLILLFKLLSKVESKHFDICIGETSFGGACAYLLRKIKIAGFSIYMNGDILPDMKGPKTYYFNNKNEYISKVNKFFDSIIIFVQMQLRKFASRNDLIWYVTDKIKNWDIKNGITVKKYFIAEAATIDYKEFSKYSKIKKQKNTLGYIGRLDEFAGLDISLESLKYIKKEIPDIKFEVVGGGASSVEYYKDIARKHGVLDNVRFHGYVPEMSDAFDILSKASLGMALYKPDKTNISLATDVSKVKEYIKVGVPVVIAKGGPAVIKEIEKYNSGIVVKYEPKTIAHDIVKVLSNNNRFIYSKLQKGLEQHAKSLNYKTHFRYVWKKILENYENA